MDGRTDKTNSHSIRSNAFLIKCFFSFHPDHNSRFSGVLELFQDVKQFSYIICALTAFNKTCLIDMNLVIFCNLLARILVSNLNETLNKEMELKELHNRSSFPGFRKTIINASNVLAVFHF